MKAIALILSLLIASPALAIVPGEMFVNPEDEARAREIGRQLRCVVCQNQSIFDSNAGLAHDLRVVVRERMVEGDSDEEILAYVQKRFGDYVLLNPPMDTHTYVLWSAPFAFLLLGGLGAALYLRSQSRRPEDKEVTL